MDNSSSCNANVMDQARKVFMRLRLNLIMKIEGHTAGDCSMGATKRSIRMATPAIKPCSASLRWEVEVGDTRQFFIISGYWL